MILEMDGILGNIYKMVEQGFFLKVGVVPKSPIDLRRGAHIFIFQFIL